MNEDTSLARREETTPACEGPRCPFYGFHLSVAMEMMVTQGGNQCALKVDSYSPCSMEMAELNPDWAKCGINNPTNVEALEKAADRYSVYPPTNAVDSIPEEGLTLRAWMARFE